MRKAPKQERSRLMVERIIDAGRATLAADGYAKFSTSRIADAAGVSPGSLYQYFRDKDELLSAVLDQYWAEVSERTAASLVDHLTDARDVIVRNSVEALVAALERDSQLLRVVVEEIPQARLQGQRMSLRQRIQEIGATYLRFAQEAPGSNPSTQAWVRVVAMEALVTRWILDRPNISRDELIEELTRLIERYSGRGSVA